MKEIAIKYAKVSAARSLPRCLGVGPCDAFSLQLPSHQLLPNLPLNEFGSNTQQWRKAHFPPRLPLLQVVVVAVVLLQVKQNNKKTAR